MTSGIYAILNISNGKRYVGSSQHIERRLQRHLNNLQGNKHENRYLQNAWNKYGETCFEFAVIENCAVERLLEREQTHINAGCDYNMAKDVIAPTRGLKLPQETVEKMRIAQRGRKHGPNTLKKMSETQLRRTPEEKAEIQRKRIETERKRSPEERAESRRRTAEANRGRRLTLEQRQKLSQGHRNLSVEKDAEMRRRMSETHKNRTPEEWEERKKKISATVQNMSIEKKKDWYWRVGQSNRGRKSSEESRRKMSEAYRNKTSEEKVADSKRKAATMRKVVEQRKRVEAGEGDIGI